MSERDGQGDDILHRRSFIHSKWNWVMFCRKDSEGSAIRLELDKASEGERS